MQLQLSVSVFYLDVFYQIVLEKSSIILKTCVEKLCMEISVFIMNNIIVLIKNYHAEMWHTERLL